MKRWEPIPGNRFVDLYNNKEITVQDVFGKAYHVKEELLQYPMRSVDDSRQLSEELDLEDLSSNSPTLQHKLVKKVREVKNVVEEFKATRSLKKSSGFVGGAYGPSYGDLLYGQESPSTDIRQIRTRISQGVQDVDNDEEERLMRSLG